MGAIEDGAAYEWAEFNLPAEAVYGSRIPSPLARRLQDAARRGATAKRSEIGLADWPTSGTAALLVPSFLVRP